MEYTVRWEIDIEAKDPEDAARKARTIQRDPKSIATVFDVTVFDAGGEPDFTRVDLAELDAMQEEDYLNDPRQ